MNNATWVCFDCRQAVRRPEYMVEVIACPRCGQPMGYLGDKIRIPTQRQIKAWRRLWKSIYSSPRPITKIPEQLRSWHVTRLEAEIARLEAMPKNPRLIERIRMYRRQLAILTRRNDANWLS